MIGRLAPIKNCRPRVGKMLETGPDQVALSAWLDSLAAKQPTPGGGAVAALSAAISAAQLSMVASYTTGPKWQDREARMFEIVSELEQIRRKALALMQVDAAAFEQVGAAYSLPKQTGAEKQARQTAIQQALRAAAIPPSDTITLAVKLVDIAGELAGQANPNLISDVTVGAALAAASLEAAIVNVEINLQQLEDASTRHELEDVIKSAQATITSAHEVIMTVKGRMAKQP